MKIQDKSQYFSVTQRMLQNNAVITGGADDLLGSLGFHEHLPTFPHRIPSTPD